MLLEPVPDAPGRSVVLRYENGAPALVASDVGRGRVLLLTATVDREWTDLPIRPGFLPLVQEAARYLAGAPGSDSISALTVGQRREIGVGVEDARIEIVTPGGQITLAHAGGAPRRPARPRGSRAAHRDLHRDGRARPLPRARVARRRHGRSSAPPRASSSTSTPPSPIPRACPTTGGPIGRRVARARQPPPSAASSSGTPSRPSCCSPCSASPC